MCYECISGEVAKVIGAEEMHHIADLNMIHVIWDGPLSVNKAGNAGANSDYGVYQIYGTHDVSGPDTLLYIGQADSGTFSGRIDSHINEWTRWNPSEVTVYLGRIAGFGEINAEEWGKLIDRVEAVLIWKIGVAYNSARIKTSPYPQERILVINHGRRHRLPELVSNVTEFVNTDTGLKVYGLDGNIGRPMPISGRAAEDQST